MEVKARAQRSLGIFLVLVGVLVVSADWLFFAEEIGCSVPIFFVLLFGALRLRSGRYVSSPTLRIFTVLLLVLTLRMIFQPTTVTIFVTTALLAALAITLRYGWDSDLAKLCSRMTQLALYSALALFWDLRALIGRIKISKVILDSTRTTVRQWSYPMLIAMVFLSLFVIANPVIASGLEESLINLNNALEIFVESFSAARLLFWCVTFLFVWNFLRARVAGSTRLPSPNMPERTCAPDQIERCLIVCNLVFLIGNICDLAYLWAGSGLPVGMTYAEYAHRGAYTLIFTALLAGAFVLYTFKPGGAAERSARTRLLVFAWIGQNVLLLASTALRLRLYIEAYSLTRWRIATLIWIFLVSLGFLWILWRIVTHSSNAALLRANIGSAMAVLYICALINVDSHIAWYNVRHCSAVQPNGPSIDLEYLKDLGTDSLPAIAWLEKEVRSHHTVRSVRTIRYELETKLAGEIANWRGKTIDRVLMARRYLSNGEWTKRK